MLYTGGTTGMPKGVMWRHEDFFYACCMGGSPLDPIKTPSEIVRNAQPEFEMSPLVLGPLMHGGGQWLTLIALFGGNRAVVYGEHHFDPELVLDLAAREKVTTIGIIGDAMARPLAEAVLAAPDRWDLDAIFVLGNGGAMLSAAVKAQLAAAFPNAIINDSYGTSETGAAGSEVGASTNTTVPLHDRRPDWVLDPDTLEPLEPGTVRKDCSRARATSRSATRRIPPRPPRRLRPTRDGVRWVLPGDAATVGPDGTIILLGRVSVCINTGGEKVFAEEVEAALKAHPDVFDAVVVGVPDRASASGSSRSSRPGTVAQPTKSSSSAHCRRHVAGYKVPRELLVGDAPRTNTGKPDYATAARIAAERLR